MGDDVADMPSTKELEVATLEALRVLGGQASVAAIVAQVADAMALTTEQRTALHGKGPTTELYYRLAWVRKGLADGGQLVNVSKGQWALADVVGTPAQQPHAAEPPTAEARRLLPVSLPAPARTTRLPEDVQSAGTLSLLAGHQAILDELVARGVIGSTLDPDREYAAGLVATALAGEHLYEDNGVDVASEGRLIVVRAVVKGETLADREAALSAPLPPASTHLALVVFDPHYLVLQALLVPTGSIRTVGIEIGGFSVAESDCDTLDISAQVRAAQPHDLTTAKQPSWLRSLSNSLPWLVGMEVGIVAAATAIYSLAEDDTIPNALYWAVTTATTVGYGDLTPETTIARITSAVLVIITIGMFVPLVTAQLISRHQHDRNAWTHEEQEEIKHAIRSLAASHDRPR